jgi:cell surface protein SprA
MLNSFIQTSWFVFRKGRFTSPFVLACFVAALVFFRVPGVEAYTPTFISDPRFTQSPESRNDCTTVAMASVTSPPEPSVTETQSTDSVSSGMQVSDSAKSTFVAPTPDSLSYLSLPLLSASGDSTASTVRTDTTSRVGLPGWNSRDTTARGRAIVDSLRKVAAQDSLRRDSVAQRMRRVITDSTWVVCLDSTSRLREFTFRRRDPLQVQIFPEQNPSLFADPHQTQLHRDFLIDSTGTTVTARERIDEVDMKVPAELTVHDYVQQRRKYELRKIFVDAAHKSKPLQGKDDLGELLSKITKIQIPIPQNPIFSIFGKGGISLAISGAVDIKAGFKNIKSDQTTLSAFDQTQNTPDFAQEVQVNVSGMIGDKLNIMADWNTQREFEYENQLKIKYTGYDDELVQSVEAGNVSLTTPSSFVGNSAALFGIKAKFQAGPLTLTTLASQKKGQIKEVNVSGGAKDQIFEFRPYEYATNHFFVDTSYRHYYEPYFQSVPSTATQDMLNTKILEAEVWVQRQGSIPDPNERQGTAFITLPAKPANGTYSDSLRNVPEIAGSVEQARFVKLNTSQYELDADGLLGILSLNVNVADQYVVGIAYRTLAPLTGGAQYGEFTRDAGADTSHHLILKLVKPRNLLTSGPKFGLAWQMLLKNIYPIPGVGRNLKKDGFAFDIFRQIPSGQDQNSILNTPLLKLFGLDRFTGDDAQNPTADGQFDFRIGTTVNLDRAEIIFPTLRPFDATIRNPPFTSAFSPPVTDTSEYVFAAVYDTTETFAEQSPRNRYVMRGKATGEATSQYALGFNVVEGSVQVLLNGVAMVNNVDYTVDYILGEVVIKNERALVPGANLQIKFEQNDLFQLASKTLLGARADLALSQSTNLGFTIMNLNQQTLSDKVRLGEEPSNNTIMEADGSTTFNLPVVTKGLNALPGLQTKEPSALKVSGEAAYMIPDPNTSKSTIPSDGGAAIAYIDDFEGARRTIPVGINYDGWYQASPPGDNHWLPNEPDTTKMFAKGKMIWYNQLPTKVAVTDLHPRKAVGTNPANNLLTVMDVQYSPATRGQFNYSTNLASTLRPKHNWGGIMKPLSISAINLLKENVNYIEIWMNLSQVPANGQGKMVIDLGAISERVIPGTRNAQRGLPNSEDLVLSDNPNGTLQEGEDVGLDMMSDGQERVDPRIAAMVASDPSTGGDPSGDDYAYDNNNPTFDHINGTEGNLNSPSGRIPDTEDLNGNGVCDQLNSYFEYELPLDTSSITNRFVAGAGIKGWTLFRIPIRDTARLIGNPTEENVEYIRIGFINADSTTHVQIGEFDLVGNQWQKVELDPNHPDSTVSVGVVSLEDNPDYQSPPGVIRESDKTQPDQTVLSNEQSLAFFLENLADGGHGEAARFYTYKALDLFDYKTMKMFVHGDPKIPYVDTSNYGVSLYFRFGMDSLNYYEYREPVHPGWDSQNDVTIQFSDITAIKLARDSITAPSVPVPVKGGPPGATYSVRGNPSLTQVAYLAIGIENPKNKGIPLAVVNGQVWVNELRLISVDDTKGWAYRFDTQLKLADVGSIGFNYQRVDPFFHTLEARFGSRQLSTSWGLATTMDFAKFLPPDFAGSSIPISYSHNESMIQPRYLPNSDILVTEAAQIVKARALSQGQSEQAAQAIADSLTLVSQSKNVSDTWAAPNFRIAVPGQSWLIRDIVNRFTLGFSYTKSKDHSPGIVSHTAWNWNSKISYMVNLSTDYFFQPFKGLFSGLWFLDEYKDIKIYYAPSTVSWSVNATRSRDVSLQRTFGAEEIIARNFAASRQFAYSWKFTEGGLLNVQSDYSLSVESTLLSSELDKNNQQRSFSKILGDIFFHSRGINFGQDTRYSQHNGFNTKPNIPNILNIKKYLDVQFSYSVDYSWQDQLTGDIGKSAGFGNSITLGLNLRLKQMFDQIFQETATPSQVSPLLGNRRTRESGPTAGGPDSTITTAPDSTTGKSKTMMQQLKGLLKFFIKTPILDYETVTITFSQSNSASNNGLLGTTGFVNYWARVPFFQSSKDNYGPSRLYQLGLISDPTGDLTHFHLIGTPPFFAWDVVPGLRAANGALSNTYRQTNRVSLKTSRNLWEGARLDLTWSVGWAYNRSQSIQTDSLGRVVNSLTTMSITGNVDRSFFTMPNVLFLGVFKSDLKEVSRIYADLKTNGDPSVPDNQKLTQSFEQGFEAFPIFRKIFGQYFPRANWSLRWDGLEKLPMFRGFVKTLSFDHAYASDYTRQYLNSPGIGEQTQGQKVAYGFTPLIGLNFTFKELAKGSIGATFKYNTNTSYDLQTSSQNLVESLTQEVSFQASYTRHGFEIPFFGLSLNNDIDISAAYSVSKNSRTTYDTSVLDQDVTGTPLEGSTTTTMEPRIKYVLSQRVSASIYYRMTKIAPDATGSRIPGSTTNEAGLDVHISIQ